MKKKRLLLFTIIAVGLLFFWAIWEAFLVCIVPQTRVRFKDFESFRDKAEASVFSIPLPESQHNFKYYYHVEWFHYLSGVSVSLSDDDYKKFIEDCIEKYQLFNNAEDAYLYDESDVRYAKEDALINNGITFCNRLLLKNEEIEDFYYIIVERIDGVHEYYNCILANDSDNRIMELSFRNTNPQDNRE